MDSDWWQLFKSLDYQGLGERPWAANVRGAAAGIAHLHKLSIVHGDLSLKNVLFQGDMVVVTDFGTAMSAHSIMVPGNVTTMPYASPENLLGSAMKWPSMDVWALGVCAMCLKFGTAPWGMSHERSDIDQLEVITHPPVAHPSTHALPRMLIS